MVKTTPVQCEQLRREIEDYLGNVVLRGSDYPLVAVTADVQVITAASSTEDTKVVVGKLTFAGKEPVCKTVMKAGATPGIILAAEAAIWKERTGGSGTSMSI